MSAFLLMVSAAHGQHIHDLGYFINQAQDNSPLLNDFNNQEISNRIDSMKLRASYGFIISGEGSASYAPAFRGWGYDEALSNGQSVFAGVRVTKEFVSRNNLNTRLDGIKSTIAQIKSQKNISVLSLKKQITDQYIATFTSQQQYKLCQEIIHLLEQEDEVLKVLTQKATFKQTDYLSFKVTLQQNLLNLQQQTADWQNNYIILNYLSGIVDTSFYELEAPAFDDNQMPVSFEESEYRKAFLADSAKLANDSKIIEYDYKPRLSAFSDAGYQSSFAQDPYKNFGVSVGLAISLPLYDGKQKGMLLKQNDLELQTRKKYLEYSGNQYKQQVLQIQNQINQYKKMLITANEQIEYARTLVEANAKQLPTGDVKMVDFILSINNLLILKGNIIQYNNSLYGLRNQLKYLILQ